VLKLWRGGHAGAEGERMKDCTHCKYADWKRTELGKLHPSGDGRCQFVIKMPALPGAFYWPFSLSRVPSPAGGWINRRKELKDDCPCYERVNG